MLSWLFKKRGAVETAAKPAVPARPAKPSTAQETAAAKAASKAPPVAVVAEDWSARLRDAQGDDAALLRIAQSAAPLDSKLAAVSALVSEDALKQAEREFRKHDRKVHRVAKQRLEAAVTQREARAKANALLERTRTLMNDAEVPINHLVALDRDWEALPARALEPGQASRYAELRAALDTQLRERSDLQQRVRQWTADARQTLPELQRAIAEAATQGAAGDLGPLMRAAEALRAARPDAAATADLDQFLALAQQAAAQVEACLAWLEAAPSAVTVEPVTVPTESEPSGETAPEASTDRAVAEAPEAASAPSPADAPIAAAAVEWPTLLQALDRELAGPLDRRHAQWQRAQRPEPVAAPVIVPPTAPVEPQRPVARPATLDAEQRQQLDTLLQQAEQALADGHLAELQQHLQAVDGVLDAEPAAQLPGSQRARLQSLRAESARLKSWQRWGGRRVLDDLVAEAEELARRTQAALDAAASAAAPAAAAIEGSADPATPAAPAVPAAPKLNLQALGESIQSLRMRWKELARQGGEAGPTLWQRFDAALTVAYQPLAAKRAAVEAARKDNLAARQAMLATLEAVPLAEPAAQAGYATTDWRAALAELQQFQRAWRQLGPIEHTVPAQARDALQKRLRAAVDRIEQPLNAARRAAAAEREQLIARATALVPDGGSRAPAPDATRQVRELQASWQDHARQLPLSREVENALWARFKEATDAVFAQRHAEFAARDAELAVNLATREALLQRLEALGAEVALADAERTLAEVERAWREPFDLPRTAIDGIEGRYRNARAAVLERLQAGVRQRWQDQCDALVAALARCEQREAPDGATGDADADLAVVAVLPPAWRDALAARASRPAGPGPLPSSEVDELLLQLEAALGLPIAPQWQAARQNLKLRALKDAMEGRKVQPQGRSQPAAWLLAMLRQGGLDAAQSERLQALLAALREAPPGSLLSPSAPR